jgi:hypothetical protein
MAVPIRARLALLAWLLLAAPAAARERVDGTTRGALREQVEEAVRDRLDVAWRAEQAADFVVEAMQATQETVRLRWLSETIVDDAGNAAFQAATQTLNLLPLVHTVSTALVVAHAVTGGVTLRDSLVVAWLVVRASVVPRDGVATAQTFVSACELGDAVLMTGVAVAFRAGVCLQQGADAVLLVNDAAVGVRDTFAAARREIETAWLARQAQARASDRPAAGRFFDGFEGRAIVFLLVLVSLLGLIFAAVCLHEPIMRHTGDLELAATEPLPPRCVCCGEPSAATHRRTFHWSPWPVSGGLLLLLLGIVPGVCWFLIRLTTTEAVRLDLPVCRRHRRYWRLRGPDVRCALLLFGPLVGFGLLGLVDLSGSLWWFFVVLAVGAGLVLGLTGVVLLHTTTIRPLYIREFKIGLRGTANGFIQAAGEAQAAQEVAEAPAWRIAEEFGFGAVGPWQEGKPVEPAPEEPNEFADLIDRSEAAEPEPEDATEENREERIRFTCDRCGRRLTAPLRHLGHRTRCPRCGRRLIVDPDVRERWKLPRRRRCRSIRESRGLADPTAGAELVRFACAGCGKRLKAPRRRIGRRTQCPRCGAELTIPNQT